MLLIDNVSGRKMTMCILPNPWIDVWILHQLKKHHKRDVKNNYRQKNILMILGQSNKYMQRWCPQTHPSWPVFLESPVLLPQSQSGLTSNKVLSFWLGGSLFTGNEDTLLLLLLQSMCSPCVTLLCFSADSSGKR